jgi:hypothetical protein
MGRIEHPLLDGGRVPTPTDLRPPPASTSYHRKVTSISFCGSLLDHGYIAHYPNEAVTALGPCRVTNKGLEEILGNP